MTEGQRFFLQVAIAHFWATCEGGIFTLPNGERLEQEDIDDLLVWILSEGEKEVIE